MFETDVIGFAASRYGKALIRSLNGRSDACCTAAGGFLSVSRGVATSVGCPSVLSFLARRRGGGNSSVKHAHAGVGLLLAPNILRDASLPVQPARF